MDHREIHAAILASLPLSRRAALSQGYDYVEFYLREHDMTWDQVYSIVEKVHFEGPPVVANDEGEKPFEIELLKREFYGDENMALAMYHLFPVSNAAHQLLHAVLEQKIREMSGHSAQGYVRDSDGAGAGAVVQDLKAMRDAQQFYGAALECLNVPTEQAKLATKALRESLVKAINEHSPAARR